MRYYVLPWTADGSGWYRREDAVKTYKLKSAAEAYARKMNDETGANLVVRSSAFILSKGA